mmetsp:Transcript_13104/g.35683  ORF Transcript_13104/g.35683 Transcript_13104/m.35683 type:complete len:200 (-) Transcript_13104:342-941(-)
MSKDMPRPAMILVGATSTPRRPCIAWNPGTLIRQPQPRSKTTLASFNPCALLSWFSGCSTSLCWISFDSSLTNLAVNSAAGLSSSLQLSKASTLIKGRLSFKGSVPVMASLRPGPETATPHLCSVAYCTRTLCSGKLGSDRPSRSAQNVGPRCSKLRSARLFSTIPVLVFNVAKLHLKAMSPGTMAMPAPMLSKAPRPR